MQRHRPYSPYQPAVGCFLLVVALSLLCLTPVFMVEAAQLALEKLYLHPVVATFILIGIVLGGFVNLPLHVVERTMEQPASPSVLYELMGWVPIVQRRRTRSIIAVNVGGCVIPVGLALFETGWVLSSTNQVAFPLALVTLTNIAVCYFVARPTPGIGIVMPAFTSPLVAVLTTWLLLSTDEYVMVRAPVAFVAGVMGPLIGADLLHLREVTKLNASVLSIGGAGTFDGIVLSGLIAAFLA